jgi:hypothetical protein
MAYKQFLYHEEEKANTKIHLHKHTDALVFKGVETYSKIRIKNEPELKITERFLLIAHLRAIQNTDMKDKMLFILASPTFLVATLVVKDGLMESVLSIMFHFPREDEYVLFMLEEKVDLFLTLC